MKKTTMRTFLAGLVIFFGCWGTVFAHLGYGIVASPDGVYFLDATRAIVGKIGPAGKLSRFATGIHGDHLIRDPAGHLYIEHLNQVLWKIAPDGKTKQVDLPGAVGTTGRVGRLDDLIAVDASGTLYFANGNPFVAKEPKILKRTPEGKTEVLAGSTAGHADGIGVEAKFTTISAAVWASERALFVTDANRIRRVTTGGEVTTLVLAGKFGTLLGIATDGEGNIFVADVDNRSVWKVDRQGNASTQTRSAAEWIPSGVAVFGNDLWISERKTYPRRLGFLPPKSPETRVVKIDSAGKTTLFALDD